MKTFQKSSDLIVSFAENCKVTFITLKFTYQRDHIMRWKISGGLFNVILYLFNLKLQTANFDFGDLSFGKWLRVKFKLNLFMQWPKLIS